jgi:hypothetical protein
MKIFHYHPETGEYLGQGVADESPLEPGVWLIPAKATNTAPPAVADHEQAVWTGKAWETQPIPEPEPEITTDPEPPAILEPSLPRTPEQKLAAAGLTVEELRILLGLD